VKRICPVFAAAFALLIGFPQSSSAYGGRGAGAALVLSETPPGRHGGAHGRAQGKGEEQAHSEHRAGPEKTWYLNRHDLAPDAAAYIVRPDGTVAEGKLEHGGNGWAFKVDTLPMDGTQDGIFTLYVVDRIVADNMLQIRVAKANMINHSCGWGHQFKFDKERHRPKSLAWIPLELVGNDLWDASFHSKTMSGDRIAWTVLDNGAASGNIPVTFTTASGWSRTVETDEDGTASVQLIRDYYPERWIDFDARKKNGLVITAVREYDEQGELDGQSYGTVRIVSTLAWKYQPARADYRSYAFGLGVTALVAVASGAGVYAYRGRRRKPFEEAEPDDEA